MGDMGEVFQAMSEHKKQIRSGREPGRISYALKHIENIAKVEKKEDYLAVIIKRGGTIRFWPYTGWFQGQKPHGKIKGRGIKNLMKALERI